MQRIKVAVVQTRSTEDIARNLQRAAELVRAAAADGAQFIALPENVAFLRIATPDNFGEPLDGPIVSHFSSLARQTGAAILLGSYQEATAEVHRVHNTSVLVGPDGAIVQTYRKIHLFDIDIPGQVSFRESEHVAAGGEAVHADLFGTRFGLSICYDLRFPELYRQLRAAGCEVLCVPAAFTLQTGKDHWEVLLRARAIENQCWLLAPGQWGHHGGPRHSYGHSMVIDPWGHVVARCSDGEGWVTAWIDPEIVANVRRNLPCQQHRRL
ncbi:MAG: carbon-nitrogen hydrolase family protein [Deltaproteobacteria bacterium]|nr:carbon-nitrogen hydrolase family protein [Deltaproteobacteria bacterium]